MNIDELLAGPHRGLRTRPGTLLLGPTGRRLWADYLDDVPGFSGRIDYIHKLNVPLLFTVDADADPAQGRSEGQWRPSHLRTRQRVGTATVQETRFITWDDEAVSVQRWCNEGTEPVLLRARVDGGWCAREGDRVRGSRHIEAHGFTLQVTITASDPAVWDGRELAPGEEYEVTLVAALRHTTPGGDGPPQDGAEATSPDLLERHLAEYRSWFDAVPELETDSPLLSRVWAYRWYLLRCSLAEPGMGLLPGTVMFEGRSHKMSKEPWRPGGWEFTKLIPLSTPFHLLDLRWRSDPAVGVAVMAAVPSAQQPDGQLHACTVGQVHKPYASFFGHAVERFARVHGWDSVSPEVLQTAKRQVRGERIALEADEDELLVQRDHKRTGKEYQPSYWYFHDYPANPRDPHTFTPLKRVDRAVYQYLNAAAVAELCARRGDPDGAEFASLADRVARSVLEKQWHPASAFFYDLHHRTDEVSLVRNVVGFYPWWARLTDGRHVEGLRRALAPDLFGTPLAYPSVAQDCPAFRPEGGWMGSFLKGRNGCMWNGPAWPYTTSLVLDALGSAALEHGLDDVAAEFGRGFWSYARSHFRDADLAVPYLVEHYNPLTGEPISDEPDYNHSMLIDLVVRYLAGVQPDEGGLRVRPLDVGLRHLALRGVRVREHLLDVELDGRGAARTLRVTCGGTVLCDGPLPADGVELDETVCAHDRATAATR
ncbi:MGH1-like glycoside hydrolase domain-containing protein [Desertihabitans aurantiacus]|uniref:MGH1-like glycoside hydrolase domain-containing protein n=1 Tax=Desertihabitans aurantiacus TaxID=2282477 RepID=UPI000DF7885F|nr:hypothetical protein [Desertihabitans aurantiacus]